MYRITDYTRRKARQIGVSIKPSTRQYKKLDVFRDGKYIDSIGDTRYSDYPTYIKQRGKEYADERRRLYHLRHTGNTQGERLAKELLW
jgi:hypothetical protein